MILANYLNEKSGLEDLKYLCTSIHWSNHEKFIYECRVEKKDILKILEEILIIILS